MARAQPYVNPPHSPISPHSHSNRTWTVAVPTGQSWVTIPREQFTTSDELLVWAAVAGQPLWPPVFVNLETQSNRQEGGLLSKGWVVLKPDSVHPVFPSSVKPGAPQLDPDVDFSEDDPLEATVQWSPPPWPPHKVLVCQFHYRRCQQMAWTLVSVIVPFPNSFQGISPKLETKPRAHFSPAPAVCLHPTQKTCTCIFFN